MNYFLAKNKLNVRDDGEVMSIYLKLKFYTCFGSYPVANDKCIYRVKTVYRVRGLAFDGKTSWDYC